MSSLLSPNAAKTSVEVVEKGSKDTRIRVTADLQLSKAGKTPVLKRRYGFFASVGLGCVVLGVWEAAYFIFQIGYLNGGPSGVLYGCLLAWAGTLGAFIPLAELASMAPVAAGQYHWISMLAPKSCHKLLSYITGWLTVLGWQAGNGSATFAFAGLIQTFIELVAPSYMPRPWHITLLAYALVALGVSVNTLATSAMPIINALYFILFLVGFVVLLIIVVVLAPEHADAKTVFATFLNEGGWSSKGLSFMIGFSGVAWSFSGADVVYHMSEEIHDASRVVPRIIVLSINISGLTGLATYLGILFSIPHPETILDSGYTYPFAALLVQCTKNVAASAVLVWIIILLGLGAVIGVFASSSRMLWSFARDGGVPGSRWLKQVNPKSNTIQNAVLVSGTFTFLIGLIGVGSAVAFNDLVSLSVAAFYGSYFMACVGLLYRRITGSIRVPTKSEIESLELINLPGSDGNLTWGPWRVPGMIGILINGWACVYLATVFFFLFWPSVTPVNGATMSYTVVIFGAVAIFSTVYYFLWARKTYKGPIVEKMNVAIFMPENE